MSSPEVGPLPPEQSSSTGGGLKTVTVKVGAGWYRIYSACITTTQPYSESAKIYMNYIHADTSTTKIHLGSGNVSQRYPFVLNNVLVEGPGSITGEVYLLDTTTSFSFVVNYRKEVYE